MNELTRILGTHAGVEVKLNAEGRHLEFERKDYWRYDQGFGPSGALD